MKRLVALVLALQFLLVGVAFASERLSGKVVSFDASTNTVVVADKDGKEVSIVVEDEATLKKLKDGVIGKDDDVNVKFVTKDGKKVSTSLKKAAGC